MKIRELEKDVKMTSTSESLGTVERERERERERAYSSKIEGLENSSSNLATAKAGAHISICAKNAREVHALRAQKISRNNAKNRIRERGVTLIALVVTVIVLLILARSNDYSHNWR